MDDSFALNANELLCFFDEKPPESIKHAPGIVALIGEDLGIALLRDYLEKRCGINSTILTRNDIPVTPTLGTGRGNRLDYWLLANPTESNHTVWNCCPPSAARRLYQVEIKNWSAHALGGKSIPRGSGEEFLRAYREQRWKDYWDEEAGFRHPECGKVLTKMAIPMDVDTPISPPIQKEEVEPILCFWYPINNRGEGNCFFECSLSAIPERTFQKSWVFSMSSYLRSMPPDTKLELDMPRLSARIDWLRRFGII